MAYGKKHNDQELKSGDINLLPEDLRRAEEKARVASGSREKLYELRSPKKVKKRKRFAWLPFFGSTHWEISKDDPDGGQQAPTPDFGVSADAPQPSMQSTAQVERGVPEPRAGEDPRITALPGAGERLSKHRDKKAFSLGGLFASKRSSGSATPPAGDSSAEKKARTASDSFSPPVRHYSLVTEREPKPAVSNAVTQKTAPAYRSSISDGERISPVSDSAEAGSEQHAKPSRSRSGGFSIPRWLDIFHWLSRLMPTSRPRRSSPANVPGALPHRAAIRKDEARGAADQQTARRHDTTEEAVEESDAAAHGPIDPITPIAEQHKPPKPPGKKKRWSVPKWLDIFYLVSTAFGKRSPHPPRHPHEQRPKAPVSAPMPERRHQAEVAETPARQSVPPVPGVQPLDAVQAPTPPAPPATGMPAIQPVTPSVETAAQVMPPETPESAALEKQRSEPITPEPISAKPDGTPSETPPDAARVRQGAFHVPTAADSGGEKPPSAPSLVNLIPASFTTMRSWKGIGQLVVLSVLACAVLTVGAYWSLEVWKRQIESRTTAIDLQIEDFRDELMVYSRVYEPEMTKLGNQIDLASLLLDRHIYWTRFFELLERYTLPDISYDGLSAGVNGSLSLSSHGSSFETVTKFLTLLHSEEAKEFVTDATITAAQLVGGGEGGAEVSFTVELELNPDLFYYHETP